MFKLMLIVSFMFIGTSLWASRLSCDSCGSECAPACGTRRFRSCCFNYLRKKREPETVKFLSPNNVDAKLEHSSTPVLLPYVNFETIPEEMISNHNADENTPYIFEDNVDNQI